MIGAETLRVMIEIGLTGEQMLALTQAIGVDMSTMSTVDIGVDTGVDIRRAKWRRQKANQRMGGGHRVDMSGGHFDPLPPVKEASHTLQENLPPSPKKPPTPPLGASGSKKSSPASRRCPPGWEPSDAVLDVGADEGMTPGEIERQLAMLRDHEFHDAHRDWDAVARNWLRKASRSLNGRSTDDLFAPSPKRLRHEQNMRNAIEGARLLAEEPRQ